MPQTTVRTNLLQPLKIITELGVNTVGKNLRVLAVHDVALPVQEPGGDLELSGVLDDSDETLELIGVKLASAVFLRISKKSPLAIALATYRLLRSTSAFLQTRLA